MTKLQADWSQPQLRFQLFSSSWDGFSPLVLCDFSNFLLKSCLLKMPCVRIRFLTSEVQWLQHKPELLSSVCCGFFKLWGECGRVHQSSALLSSSKNEYPSRYRWDYVINYWLPGTKRLFPNMYLGVIVSLMRWGLNTGFFTSYAKVIYIVQKSACSH